MPIVGPVSGATTTLDSNTPVPSMRPPSNITCPRDGSKWYICGSGSLFVGCCRLNPCKYGCGEGYVGSVLLTEDAYRTLPSAQCSSGSRFYSCNLSSRNITYYGDQTYYWGCCKSNACQAQTASGCPLSDVGMPTLRSVEQLAQYLLVEQQDSTILNVSVKLADAPPNLTETNVVYVQTNSHNGRILATVTLALLTVLPAMVMLWFIQGSRRLGCRESSRKGKLLEKAERTPLEASSDGDNASNKNHMADVTSQDALRLGSASIYILSATSVIVIGVCGFLNFLWIADYTNATWNNIMIQNWATRAVSISSLILRTAVDFQAAIASAMLAALLLESRAGVLLSHLADLSPMRAGAVGPWSLAEFVSKETWRSANAYNRNYTWLLITCGLLVTTTILQFSSTLLLSDIKPGPLGSHVAMSDIRSGLSYQNVTRRITRDTAWTSNPHFYPTFGEYSEPAPTSDSISDTGFLLRSFLPYETTEDRQNLRSYSGPTMILDARVSCQAPEIRKFNGTDHYAEVTGTISATEPAEKLQNIAVSSFACSIAGVDEYALCQLGQNFPGFIGSLNSSFGNSTSYGTAFLVSRGFSNKTIKANGMGREWLDVTFANQTGWGTSFSICFASWDASILDVSLTSTSNRTEPVLQWWDGFKTDAVRNQLLPTNNTRPILQMEKPRSLFGYLPPQRERPLVQSDASGSSAAEYGSNTPLPENWSIFLTGEPFITLLNHFSLPPSRTISADPALAAIFVDTMDVSGSVSWALSSLITVLSMTNYYSHLPAFDLLDTVQVSSYTNVLQPRDNFGFVALLWTLVAHYIIVVTVVVLFVTRTRLTLLGNAWSAFSQMAGSLDMKEHIRDMKLKELGGKNANLRARLVRRSDVTEFVVE